jgi:hypothetical protein
MNARKTKTPVELATEFVTDSIDTAKATFAGEAGPAKESVEALSASAKVCQDRLADIQAKSISFFEANTKAVLGFWREAANVKSPEALFALQQGFFKSQSEVALKQFQDLNDATVALVRDASAPVQDGLKKSFAAFPFPKAA